MFELILSFVHQMWIVRVSSCLVMGRVRPNNMATNEYTEVRRSRTEDATTNQIQVTPQ
jgi:hypothetical protein